MKHIIFTLVGSYLGFKVAEFAGSRAPKDDFTPYKPLGLMVGGYAGYELANSLKLGDYVGLPPLVLVPVR